MTNQFTKVLLFVAASLVLFCACRDNDTYAERREKEDKQIQAFLRRGCVVRDKIHGFDVLNVPGNIKVISEAQFLAQDTTTDVSKTSTCNLEREFICKSFARAPDNALLPANAPQ